MPKSYFFFFILFVSLHACEKSKIEADVIEMNSNTILMLNKIIFFNESIGFIAGGNRYEEACLLRTVDGGSSWNRIKLPDNAEKKAIYGMDILPNGRMITVGFGGTIYLSDDTGKTFNYLQHKSWREFQDVAFNDADSFIIIGGVAFENGFVTRMKSNGEQPTATQEEWKAEMTDIEMLDNKTGYMCGFGSVLKTTDGGAHWKFTSAKNDYFKAMSWKNAEEGIVIGNAGSILKTTDGGAHWKTIRNGNSIARKKLLFYNVTRSNDDKLLAVGENGCVCLSINSGDSWTLIKPFTKEDLRGVVFLNNNTVFVVGTNGKVFKLSL